MNANGLIAKNQIGTEIEMTIDYRLNFEEMKSASNRVIVSDARINFDRFPKPELFGEGRVLAQAFNFGVEMSLDAQKNKLAEFSYRPANLAEIIYFQLISPTINHEKLLVAGNAIWRDALGNRFIVGAKFRDRVVSELTLINLFGVFKAEWGILGIRDI